VDERARAVQSLSLSDRRFRLTLEATKDAVYERDAGTDTLAWSGNGLAPIGYVAEQSPHHVAAMLAMVHPDDRERTANSHRAAIDGGGQVWEAEFRLRRADGSYADMHEQGFIVRDGAGKPRQLVAALRDITERRLTEELNQRLAHASRLTAMGELTASIAHEINQPISAILSNVDAAEMLLDAGASDTAEFRQILKDIRDDDLRASEVIQHIRGLANKRRIDVEPFDVNALVQAALRLVAATLRQRSVAVTTRFGHFGLVAADRIHTQQVLLNLVFNGVDAMADVPQHARRLEIATAAYRSTGVQVSVRDRGHGIAPEHFDRIFESFFTTKRTGMGMGLSIARSLVEHQGGTIWAENDVGGGAIFRFTVPLIGQP
jgi:PAS domain S-box-containing protein